MEAEIRFSAMGTQAHVLIAAENDRAAEQLLANARARVEDLEQKWSRFVATSEVSRLNNALGQPTVVSADTIRLIAVAADAFEITDGLVDATMLDEMLAIGYDRSFPDLFDATTDSLPDALPKLYDPRYIVIGDGTVCLPFGVGFDPGGIGKGLAADIVAEEAITSGASGAMVSLGGDIRALGQSPDREGWTIDIVHPDLAEPIARVGIRHGAVASSTTLKRRWTRAGRAMHHLLDPATRRPTDSSIEFATAICDTGWRADAVAKAVLIGGGRATFGGRAAADFAQDECTPGGTETLTVGSDGTVRTTPGFDRYTGGVQPSASARQASGLAVARTEQHPPLCSRCPDPTPLINDFDGRTRSS